MITKLLIANRGEIARRIARTAADMGIRTVAVHADGAGSEPFVKDADDAVGLPGRSAAETYLHAGSLLEAARIAGADAVHPGYGFLSENASFAQAVIDSGLVWVGPPPAAIAAMGDKLEAKRLMAKAGVPTLPSWELHEGDAPDQWPVVLKAAAGGGGKGMRVVDDPSRLGEELASARREAAAAFGDPTVFAERYVTGARHVEVQVLADEHGGLIHCFERECSIQRRHQKIIEEAPSPAVGDELRLRMTEAALAAARSVGYRSAGTVEFVLADNGDFYFLEVNTRLQVEHPVTEAVTGLDLVREQLRIASGLPLSVGQGDMRINGHAIEARLYAEDPETGFLPATGRVAEWTVPDRPAVRVDSGIETGSVVGVEWDPMLAKLISHAPSRTEAALALALALQRTRIRGVTTNRDYLVGALRHPDFLAGRATTSFVDRAEIARRRAPGSGELRAAAAAAALAGQARRRAGAGVLRSMPTGWRNSVMPDELVEFVHRDKTISVTYRADRHGVFRGHVDGEPFEADARRRPDVLNADGRWWVQTAEGDVELAEVARFPDVATETVSGALAAPMPGKVLAVNVKVGEPVPRGHTLVIVEAMKMEHRLTAPHAGTIEEIRVVAGQQVDAGDLLVVLTEQMDDGQ